MATVIWPEKFYFSKERERNIKRERKRERCVAKESFMSRRPRISNNFLDLTA